MSLWKLYPKPHLKPKWKGRPYQGKDYLGEQGEAFERGRAHGYAEIKALQRYYGRPISESELKGLIAEKERQVAYAKADSKKPKYRDSSLRWLSQVNGEKLAYCTALKSYGRHKK